uniref:RING-type E3 ubiquitin transferase n=1 Tax=Phallusia mammillata TaxID=59560 RepID=A0A6F9DWW9_9ASCI|nr:UHRF2 protein [Phallusia mammillata]
MWIHVRTMDGKRSEQIDGISKLTKIEDIREIVEDKFGVIQKAQRLFFRGKQLENGYKLFDYDVCLNDIIQLVERKPILAEVPENSSEKTGQTLSDTDSGIESIDPNLKANNSNKPNAEESSSNLCSLYKINDLVDAQDTDTGAWFEAKIKTIQQKKASAIDSSNKENTEINDMTILYCVQFDDYEDEERQLEINQIRPRARKLLEWNDINIEDKVMVNYNMDKHNQRGFWYDGIVLQKKIRRNKSKELVVRLLLGPGKELEPCTIVFVEEIFVIEKPGFESGPVLPDVKRKTEKEPDCGHCNDNPRRKCKECGCNVCGEKKDFDKTLLCDECNLPFHTFCLDPPLDSLPEEDDWFCPLCRHDNSKIIEAGERLKENKKKSKMKSSTSETQRDWGKGMACVGRSKICTIVPSNHVGPIPGVPVGTLWKFRVQVSEAGVHRPHVSGIHGKESEGAFSIVLAGGYEDDEDNGDEFTYTGSGGRDLSGNKRTAEQSCDQVLTKSNMAIARTCHVKVDAKNGAESSDWKKSRPIRVVRNYKGAKHSEYAPEEGNRYDGLYKVVKYWPDKGKSGFIVWRYLFRRDDPEPSPWTKSGKKRSKTLGITMQYPDGYLENQAQKNANEDSSTKRKRSDVESPKKSSKKAKIMSYQIDGNIKKLIMKDIKNKLLWEEGLQSAKDGQQKFFEKLQDLFACVCCQDLVFQPITTTCNHNMCKGCLQRSFKAEVYSCPVCRFELGSGYSLDVNDGLREILVHLLPGYENGR